MLLCFFTMDGAYAGYARFDDEKLQACRVSSEGGEPLSDEQGDWVLPLPVTIVTNAGDTDLIIENKRSGEPGFLAAFLRHMQQRQLFGVLFTEEERIDLFREFLRAKFEKTLQARYATLLALWPKDDLAVWSRAIAASV